MSNMHPSIFTPGDRVKVVKLLGDAANDPEWTYLIGLTGTVSTEKPVLFDVIVTLDNVPADKYENEFFHYEELERVNN